MHTCNCHPDPSAEAGLTLAMATIPIQPWEKPYDPETALRQGTMFPGLNKPFYVIAGNSDAGSPSSARPQASSKPQAAPALQGVALLQALDFTLTDLVLYLDTHPDDADARETFHQVSEHYSNQKREAADKPHFSWSDDPLPWDNQGGAI